MEFKLHPVQWTDEKVARFWDSFSSLPHLQYFAQQVGKKVINIARPYISLKDSILDYGSGKGFLIGYLLDDKASDVSGCDFSVDSVNHVNKLFAGKPGYKGCTSIESLPSSLAANSYGSVFFMETIEHLLDQHYEPTLQEIQRVLKPGGHVIVTTRNEENLDNLKVICPDCGSIFHRVQHVRSFSKASMTEVMNKFGFDKVFCESKDLGRDENTRWIFERYRKLKGREFNNPNLIYIGRKRR